MQDISWNLPPLGTPPELISCATGLRFEYVGVTIISALCIPFPFDLMIELNQTPVHLNNSCSKPILQFQIRK